MHIVKKKFSVKVFVALTIFIFFVTFSFTAYYIHDQKKALIDELVLKGNLLAGILAHASRIGVFSENEALLQGPMEGILHQEGVLDVTIFNSECELLTARKVSPAEDDRKSAKADGNRVKNMLQKIEMDPSPLYRKVNGNLEFWSPVMSVSDYFIQA